MGFFDTVRLLLTMRRARRACEALSESIRVREARGQALTSLQATVQLCLRIQSSQGPRCMAQQGSADVLAYSQFWDERGQTS